MDFLEKYRTTVKNSNESLHKIFGFILGDSHKYQKDCVIYNKYSDLRGIGTKDFE